MQVLNFFDFLYFVWDNDSKQHLTQKGTCYGAVTFYK